MSIGTNDAQPLSLRVQGNDRWTVPDTLNAELVTSSTYAGAIRTADRSVADANPTQNMTVQTGSAFAPNTGDTGELLLATGSSANNTAGTIILDVGLGAVANGDIEFRRGGVIDFTYDGDTGRFRTDIGNYENLVTSGPDGTIVNKKYVTDQIATVAIPPLDGLTDVTITGPLDNDVLTYQGGIWINQAPVAPPATVRDVVDMVGATNFLVPLTFAVWTPVQGISIGYATGDFATGANPWEVQYNGASTKQFKVTLSVSSFADQVDRSVIFGFKKTGALTAWNGISIINYTLNNSSGPLTSSSMTRTAQITPGSTFEVAAILNENTVPLATQSNVDQLSLVIEEL
jgi:hypothetical protein